VTSDDDLYPDFICRSSDEAAQEKFNRKPLASDEAIFARPHVVRADPRRSSHDYALRHHGLMNSVKCWTTSSQVIALSRSLPPDHAARAISSISSSSRSRSSR
jgi:hypothetical protein